MTILITGAAGFLGTRLVRHLAAGAPQEQILATDVAPEQAGSAFDGLENVRLVALDVTDREATRETCLRERPDRLVHAAALTLRDEEARTEVFEVNLGGTVSVLAAAAEAGVRRILVTSSSTVYAGRRNEPRGEGEALDAGSAYTASKIAAEAAAEHVGAVAVRIGPTYGPGETPRASRPRLSAPGRLAEALAAGRAVTLCDAGAVRDWTHVDDVADGLARLLAAERLAHPVYNLSAGRPEPFAAVAEAFGRHGLAYDWVEEDAAEIGPDSFDDPGPPLSIARIAGEIGFAPRHSLRSGLETVMPRAPVPDEATGPEVRPAEGAERAARSSRAR